LDYIRFPVDDGIKYAEFPSKQADDARERWQVLLPLLARIDEAVKIPLGADVFGLTAFNFGDDTVLGQRLHEWTRHIEVFSPMLYLYAMRSWARGNDNRAFGLLYTGISQMRARVGPTPVIRPFVQAFVKSGDDVGTTFVSDEVRGAKSGGADGVLFWHPGSNYKMLFQGMNVEAKSLVPFDTTERSRARSEMWKRVSGSSQKTSVAGTKSYRDGAHTK
ncbi:MAG: hypothetical protein KC417_03365, partial [Myxococcales bacterium]|nr:hypothetical protein [Myxococcales bacterium]